MKIRDILTEGIIPHDFVKEADGDFDLHNNYEAHYFSEKNRDYYRQNFNEFYQNGQVPVFQKPAPSTESKFTTEPNDEFIESPGARGHAIVKKRLKR